jgi:2,4-dienoyl-CoA reductase-like NADH-dependent reductase (Old Yellow Enzyme family)
MANVLFSQLTLPNGAVISNRIAKAAMAESLAGFGPECVKTSWYN